MSDIQSPLQDIAEESPSGTVSRSASQPTLLNIDNSSRTQPEGELHHHHDRPRRNSNVSHVDIDFFDPDGVGELRRTLSRKDDQDKLTRAHTREKEPLNDPEKGRLSSTSSDATLNDPDAPFDFQKTLLRVIRKREEHNIKPRSLGIAFRDLRVSGLTAASSYFPTLGSVLNPMSIVENLQSLRHPNVRDILSGFEGVVKPGEMILVLGNPGSGCSTLLKTLTNQRKEYHAVSGYVHYDAFSPEELAKHFRGDVQYCPEDDVHFPTLTVQQTISFAAAARTPRDRMLSSRKAFADRVTTTLATIFGLKHALHTPVGDAAIRGVSGGEKKRVSISESLASRACIGAWDNSTRGLDASTALEFVRALRLSTDTFELTTLVSIYQAAESLCEYFDKVCVIDAGRMVYFGPADQAKQYFLDMGYEPANRQTTPDFLVAVTDPNARIPRPGFSNQPRTAAEFAEYFRKSPQGRASSAEVDEYLTRYVGNHNQKTAYVESARAEFAKGSGNANPYMLRIPQQIAIVMRRRVQILLGNKLNTGLVLFSFVFQGLIMGSVFLNSPEETSAFFSRGGVLFFAILFSALSTMAEIPALYSQRPIVNRHQKSALYRPFVEAMALTLVDVPITLLTSVVFSIIIYFMVGLQRSAGQYFIFLLFLFTMALCMKAWFRGIAAMFASEATAQSVAGIAVLALSIYTGFTIPKPSMIGALRWITYINPLKYGFESVMANEFHTLRGSCSNLVPQGPGYENVSIDNQVCTTVGAVPGQSFVEGQRFVGLAYGFHYSNVWMEPSADTSKAAVAAPRMNDIFSWKNINYTVTVDGADRRLLSDVTGYVAPGKLTALMGESGAGKTTLLNVLAMRTDTGVVRGDRFVNGQALPADFQSQSGYVQQMDTHVPFSTVREALLFSAKLRQPRSVPDAEKEAYVEKCLEMCGLVEHADASVGSLSIEHKKRTTIGVELAAKPKLLLFLDEPTSGLDSQSAWAIISFLRTLADNGQAILCTIHQPSAELFQVFDRMLLLRKGGQTCYFGDIGRNATTLIDYFERNGARTCLPNENPAEYMLDVIGAGATATSEQDWYSIWKAAPESVAVQEEVEKIHVEGRSRPAVTTELLSEFATPWFYQTWQLLKRDFDAHWRDPTYIMAKLVLNAFGGLFIGFTFFKAKDSQQGTQNKLFAIFMATILSVPLSNQLQVPFIKMRTIYEIRERPSRMYSWTALLTSQILIELPWNIIGSFILFICWYWTVGFENSRAGYTFLMLVVAFPAYYGSFGQAVAAMAPSAEIAAVLFSFLFSFVITFNGVMQPYSRLGWWQWMYHLSPYTYLVEGLLGQAIGGYQVNCSPIEFSTINPPSGMTCEQYMNPYIASMGGYLTNPTASAACQFCSVRTTDEFLKNAFNIYYSHRWRNFGIFVAFICFNVFLVFALTYLFRIRKGSLIPSFRRKKN
ncbi:hypothetical protein M413DRAFT_448754 [Hebeloma cylindrosporum]|uniref:ABC transporter domain-containing protein n=1 Tax=Hebeloma cylindrosporum TaxID=76867 RepID=A0A0C2Y7N4_HEBCY|nr:hypothetical protein M413DRAFT_448754 [Hebeloma cylindrosporum h7]